MKSALCGSLVLMTLLMSACAGPRSDVITRERALGWTEPIEVRVIQVHDGLHHSRDPHVSHLVEVEVRQGKGVTPGENLTFPYDEWMTGSEPPERGAILFIAPSQWVRRNKGSAGTPSPFYR